MTYEQRLRQVELAMQPPSADQLAAERQAARLGHRIASLHRQLDDLELASSSASSEEEERLRRELVALRDEQCHALRRL
jgi:uncharacterized protein YdcH (DUF465 family)